MRMAGRYELLHTNRHLARVHYRALGNAIRKLHNSVLQSCGDLLCYPRSGIMPIDEGIRCTVDARQAKDSPSWDDIQGHAPKLLKASSPVLSSAMTYLSRLYRVPKFRVSLVRSCTVLTKLRSERTIRDVAKHNIKVQFCVG
jgi:hypothetical protein